MPKISQLTELIVPQDTDILAIVDATGTKKITKENLLSIINSNYITSATLSIGDETDKVIVDDSGVRLYGETTTYTDLVFPLTQAKIGANLKPDFIEDEVAYGFPQNNTGEYFLIIVQMPHQWEIGSTIYPHVHWKQTQNLSPVFKIDYKWINIGDPVPVVWETYIMNNLARSYVSGQIHQINDGVTGISGVGKTLSSMLLIKLYRDDNVYTGDALTYQFDIHYRIDSFGSNYEYIK